MGGHSEKLALCEPEPNDPGTLILDMQPQELQEIIITIIKIYPECCFKHCP